MPSDRTKLTPPQLARQWGVSADKILSFIRSGELRAVNAASKRGGRPRYLIDVADIAAFEAAREASSPPPAKPRRQRKQDAGVIAFY